DRRAVATVPISPDEERPLVPAQAVAEAPGGGEPAGGLRRPGPARGREATGDRREEVSNHGPGPGGLAGGERAPGPDDLRPAGLAPEAAEDLEHAGAAQRGDQAEDEGGRAVPE